MYKKTSKSTHYLPRTGSYSTHPARNGRVDVLPPEAIAPLYDTATQLADANNRLEQLRKKREDIRGLVFSLTNIDKLRSRVGSSGSEKTTIAEMRAEDASIEREMQAIKNRAGKLRATLGGRGTVSVEQVFMRLAEAELPHEMFAALRSKAQSVFDKSKARQ